MSTVGVDEALDEAGSRRGGDGSIRALQVLRRGIAASPELRAGIRSTIGLALVVAAGRLVIPVSIQQILDRGVSGPDGVRVDVVVVSCVVAGVVIVGLAALNRVAYLRLVNAAEAMLYGLRTKAFDHVHRLSIGHHSDSRRGVLVSRVTSDVETLAQFAQWGAVSWIVNTAIIITTLAVMALYSWQLTLLVVVVFTPIIPLLRIVQRHQIAAYDDLRTSVGETLTEVSESVMGAAVIRAYGMEAAATRRLNRAIARQYRAQMRAAWYFALMFPVSDAFGAVGLAAVIGVGAWWGPGWGLAEGSLVAFIFLTNLLLQPIGEIGEVLDQTQTAIAGWNKVLDLLDEPIDVVEPVDGIVLPEGPLSVIGRRRRVRLRGRPPGAPRRVRWTWPPGTSVAIVGETGSGKSTLATLLCRLADPRPGTVRLGRSWTSATSIPTPGIPPFGWFPRTGSSSTARSCDNIAMGRPGATDRRRRHAPSSSSRSRRVGERSRRGARDRSGRARPGALGRRTPAARPW